MDRDAAPSFYPGEQPGSLVSPAPGRTSAGRKPASNPSDRARRRRVAAERTGRESRLLLCEIPEKGPVQRLLQQLHFSFVVRHGLDEALRETSTNPVDVAVVVLERSTEERIGLLQLLRRSLPRTPIVLVLDDPTPAARLATLTVRPFYVAVPPVGPDEMAAVLRDALIASRKKR